MPADSPVRRAAKKALAPLLGERTYGYIQAASMARDIRSGAYSEPEIELIDLIVSRGDTAIDIGANYGMYTYPLSRAVGPGGRVWAFEPIPFTAETLRIVARLMRMSNVEIVAKGCADHTGTAVFDLPLQDNGAVSAGQAHTAARDDAREGCERHARWHRSKQLECPVVALDEFLTSVTRLSLIKADIEGGELFALRGAERLISEHHPTVVCEINPWFLEGLGIGSREPVEFFTDKEYAVFRYVNGRLREVADIDEDNFVFVHPDRRASLEALIDRRASCQPVGSRPRQEVNREL